MVRLVHTDHAGATRGETGSHGKQERSGARHQDAGADDHAVALQQRLRAARRHDPRQVPPGERQGAVVRAGGEHELATDHRDLRGRHAGAVHGVHGATVVVDVDVPHVVLGEVTEGSGREVSGEGPREPVVAGGVVVQVGVGSETRGPVPPELTADAGRGVDDHHGRPGVRRGDGGGESGRAGSDDHDVGVDGFRRRGHGGPPPAAW
jgi:hypothetical protein